MQCSISIQLNVKTVLFQTIQFSVITQFSSIWPIDRTLSGATTLSESEPGSDSNKGVLYIPQAPALLKHHHQIVWCHIQDTRWERLTPLQKCSRCILQPSRLGKLSLKLSRPFSLQRPYALVFALEIRKSWFFFSSVKRSFQ